MRKRSVAKLVLIVATIGSLVACGSKPISGDQHLANDPAASTEIGRLNQLLASQRPVTRIDLDILRSLRERYPTSVTVRKLLQNALIRRQDWAAAEEILLDTPEAERTNADRLNLAKVFVKQGKFDQAIHVVQTMQMTDTDRVEALALLGHAQFAAGAVDDAISNLESVRADLVAQKRGDDLATLGMSYLRRGDTAKSIETLQQALGIAPQNISAHSALIRAYTAAGDREKAESAGAKLQQLNATVAAHEKKRSRLVPLFYELEDAYAAKDFARVITLVERIRPEADEATLPTLYQYLAAAYQAQGKIAEAREAMTEAQRLTSK